MPLMSNFINMSICGCNVEYVALCVSLPKQWNFPTLFNVDIKCFFDKRLGADAKRQTDGRTDGQTSPAQKASSFNVAKRA